MSWFKKIATAISGNDDFWFLKPGALRKIGSGDILTTNFFKKQYGLLIMISLLSFMYVDNRYACESLLAKQVELKKQIQDAKYEALTLSAELMRISRKSNVQTMILEKGLTLEESATPPLVINDTIEAN